MKKRQWQTYPKVALFLFLLPAFGWANYGPISSILGVYGIIHKSVDGYFLPFAGEGNAGTFVSGRIYMGAAADYWYARRETTTRGTDSIRYLSVGGEIGYVRPSPRMYWGLIVGAFFPAISQVVGENGDIYLPDQPLLSYRGRLIVGMRVQPWLALTATAGYRIMELGNFTGPGGSFNESLSTFFGGVGFAFTL
ncbi:hypothetical protein K2X33_01800 [bacterium]|nr:hypothetical protein [bacterium]